MKLGIVSTVRDSADVLEAFVRYHLALGFGDIWLFFDAPHDPLVASFAPLAGVHAVAHDAALRARWRASRLGLESYIDREVMARQALNAELALQAAAERGVEWLLHIDSDELFLPLGDLEEHFRALTAGGAEIASYHNLEALPRSADAQRIFLEHTLFKVGPGLQPGGAYSPDQQRALEQTAPFRDQFFMSYRNGKSAARVDAGLLPVLVHSFAHPRRAARFCVGRGLVLHYPNANFDRFWDKYVALGAFSDRWFDQTDVRATVGDFHTAARDIVAGGDRWRARQFYEAHMVLRDPASVLRLCELDLLRSIDAPRALLSRVQGESDGAHACGTS